MEPRWLELGLTLLLTWLLWLQPTLSRPELFFGVTVPATFRGSPKGQQLLGQYRWAVIALAAITCAVLLTSPRIWGVGAGVGLLACGALLVWFVFRGKTLPFAAIPSGERSAALDVTEQRLPGGMLLKAGPYLILAATGIYLYVNFDLLPDPFPTHFSGAVADRFEPKSWTIVFRSLAIMGGVCIAMGVTALSLASGSLTRRVSLLDGDEREPRFHGMQLSLLLGAQYLVSIANAWINIALRGPHALPTRWASFGLYGLTVTFLCAAVYFTLRYGQGGWRLPGSDLTARATPFGDQTPDHCWKLGQFYYNAEDPALWVEKRAGVGYTLNFARPLSWVWLFAILAGPLILVRLMR